LKKELGQEKDDISANVSDPTSDDEKHEIHKKLKQSGPKTKTQPDLVKEPSSKPIKRALSNDKDMADEKPSSEKREPRTSKYFAKRNQPEIAQVQLTDKPEKSKSKKSPHGRKNKEEGGVGGGSELRLEDTSPKGPQINKEGGGEPRPEEMSFKEPKGHRKYKDGLELSGDDIRPKRNSSHQSRVKTGSSARKKKKKKQIKYL